MKKKITILPGDGIGKEVTACGKKVLDQIALFGCTGMRIMSETIWLSA